MNQATRVSHCLQLPHDDGVMNHGLTQFGEEGEGKRKKKGIKQIK